MRISGETSPFEVLGVAETANDEEVRAAYRKKAVQYHPDRNTSEAAEEQFKRIQTAYSLIKDEASRRRVLRIIHMRRAAAAVGAMGPGGGGGVQPGHRALDPNIASTDDIGEFERKHFVPEKVFIAEVWASFMRAMRLERFPFKLLGFVPFMLLLNWLHQEGTQLQPLTALKAVGQACIGALLTDMLLQAASRTTRHQLRSATNKFVGWAVVLALLMLFVTIEKRVVEFVTHIGLNEYVIRGLAVVLFTLSAYFWFVFCFLFQRHHPTWETAFVWIGVMGGLYFYFFVIL